MPRQALEVADVFRASGPAWRQAHTGHLYLGQLKAMSAIERCRSAVLGGHVLRCESCTQIEIAYNSCRNRHCPKCQAIITRIVAVNLIFSRRLGLKGNGDIIVEN